MYVYNWFRLLNIVYSFSARMITVLVSLACWKSPRSPTWLRYYFLYIIPWFRSLTRNIKNDRFYDWLMQPRNQHIYMAFFYAEHGKLTIEVGIRIFSIFYVISVKIVYCATREKKVYFSLVAHDFFFIGGSKNWFFCPKGGNKRHFMTH